MKLYKKIDFYYNNEYLFSSKRYKTLQSGMNAVSYDIGRNSDNYLKRIFNKTDGKFYPEKMKAFYDTK